MEGSKSEWGDVDANFQILQKLDGPVNVQAANNRMRKGQAVAQQMKQWWSTLGVRIPLQKSLTLADRLPQSEAQPALVQFAPQVAPAVLQARQEVIGSLRECMDAMHDMLRWTTASLTPNVKRHTEVLERAQKRPQVNPVVWEELCHLEACFQSFRNAEVDRWYRKTMLASGHVALHGHQGLQALNKPISQQVADTMAQSDRSLTKFRRIRQNSDRVLCHPVVGEADATEDDLDGRENISLGHQMPDPESYDDSIFYQVLLQEFLETAVSSDGKSDSFKVVKHRKLVDRRASKGRKIRYNVMSKLVSFMEPTNTYHEVEPSTHALFNNLFGQCNTHET